MYLTHYLICIRVSVNGNHLKFLVVQVFVAVRGLSLVAVSGSSPEPPASPLSTLATASLFSVYESVSPIRFVPKGMGSNGAGSQ